jgi:hypothetical protein
VTSSTAAAIPAPGHGRAPTTFQSPSALHTTATKEAKDSLATHCDSIDMAYPMSSASYVGRWLVGAHRIFGIAAVLRAEGGGRGLLTVKFRQPSREFTFGVDMSFIPYPLILVGDSHKGPLNNHGKPA